MKSLDGQLGVFISHTSTDKEFARRLAVDLSAGGARVWIDEAEIKVGDSLIAKIQRGIDETDYVAIVLSPMSVASEWVRRELDVAMNLEIEQKRVTVLPLLLHDCELPGFLRGKKYADFRKPNNYDQALVELFLAIGLPVPINEQLANLSPTDMVSVAPKSAQKPTRCPECNGALRDASIATAYSGDGDYLWEEGLECCECRKNYVLIKGELLWVDSKHPARPW